MSSWRSSTTTPGSPADVLELLTDPTAISRWAPLPFEVRALNGTRLRTGGHARVAGRLAGRAVEFDVDVLRASDEGLELIADGPVSLCVRYMLAPADSGSRIDALVSVEGHGLRGRVLAKATEALLTTGALHLALARLARQVEPSPAS